MKDLQKFQQQIILDAALKHSPEDADKFVQLLVTQQKLNRVISEFLHQSSEMTEDKCREK